MPKEDTIEVEGTVTKLLVDAQFLVMLENNKTIKATLRGKMRLSRIQVQVGDRVKVELSPYDLTKGRIIFRQK